MTKNEAKRVIRELLNQVDDLRFALEDLERDASETCDEIEPYEGRDELTPAQEERQEWFSDLSDKMNEALSELDNIQGDLEEMDY